MSSTSSDDSSTRNAHKYTLQSAVTRQKLRRAFRATKQSLPLTLLPLPLLWFCQKLCKQWQFIAPPLLTRRFYIAVKYCHLTEICFIKSSEQSVCKRPSKALRSEIKNATGRFEATSKRPANSKCKQGALLTLSLLGGPRRLFVVAS